MFGKFLVWQKVLNRKGVSRFSVGNFSSTIPQSLVAEPFCISENLSIGKTYAEGQNTILPKSLSIRRGEGARVTIFHGKIVVSKYRKTS